MQISLKPRQGAALLGVLFMSLILTAAASLAAAPGGRADQSPATADAPNAVFPQVRYDFESVMEGVQIKHDFVIENSGKAPLLIKKVRPS